MPKWVFHHTAGTFTVEDKHRIANGMVEIYKTIGLPAFYCHAHFFELPENSIFAGGEYPSHPSAFLTTLSIYHIAQGFPNREASEGFLKALDSILRPILKLKKAEWELAIYEANRDYWRVNGLMAPETGSDMEKKWAAANQVTDEEQLLHAQGY
ncbi:unnamed protein product [Clonostachys byssicola]|uniref:Tautomerase cis-CaaD-like domain-containing protein n=1 Tax=Clonostachys byssicola TaxID=160290 RepID=A0A9N9UHX7_9HYPO|nr:unnamed protein product [Clonostachys byssicola]